MKPFKLAKWIWAKDSLEVDDYAEFKFEIIAKKKINIKISCDSVYAFYLNGELIKFFNCSDYPFYKYFDQFEIDIKKPQNEVIVEVWHYGIDSSNYYNAPHGLILEIIEEDNILAYTSENTLSRVMNEYKQGYKKIITPQLGLSFYFDNTVTKSDYQESILVDKTYSFVERKIHPLVLLDKEKTKTIRTKPGVLIDLGKEKTGFIDLEVDSKKEQKLLIAFGEHIADGKVRQQVGGRDFSIEIKIKPGYNHVFSPFRRIAGRYLEIFYEEEIDIKYAGIRQVNYQHEVISKDFHDELLNRIYKTCINTLELCMHEHYEDCPWREQSLYVLDSRNQMLCGYYVFKGYEYQRHNLLLIANSFKKDIGLLALTSPYNSVVDFPIPFFSLNYIKQVYEYITYSGDKEILKEVKDVLYGIMHSLLSFADKNGLIPYLSSPFWNFYEWTDGSQNDVDLGDRSKNRPLKYDFILNGMFIYASKYYNELMEDKIETSKMKQALKDTLYDKKRNLYQLSTKDERSSQLATSLALLIGIGNEDMYEKLINDKSLIEASLSTRCFVYDALLEKGDKYYRYIIEDIKYRYKKMLDDGATSFYETEEGQSAFDNAGSLCHGWSALPIYYFNLLLK